MVLSATRDAKLVFAASTEKDRRDVEGTFTQRKKVLVNPPLRSTFLIMCRNVHSVHRIFGTRLRSCCKSRQARSQSMADEIFFPPVVVSVAEIEGGFVYFNQTIINQNSSTPSTVVTLPCHRTTSVSPSPPVAHFLE